MAKKDKNKKDSSLTDLEMNTPIKTTSKFDQHNTSTIDNESTLLFGKKNYGFLLAGTGLIAIGYFLMAGGSMPSPDVWDESLIYSTRRTLIAPIFILSGLIMQVYTIFAKK